MLAVAALDAPGRWSWAPSTALLVAYGRVPAIIATLGTLALYRVVLVEISGRQDRHHVRPARLAQRHPGRSNLVQLRRLRPADHVRRSRSRSSSSASSCCGTCPSGGGCTRSAPTRTRRASRACPSRRDVFLAFTACGALAGLGRVHVPRALRQHHGHRRPGPRAPGGGGGRGRRRVNIFGGTGSMVGAFMGVLIIEILQQSLLRWAEVSEFVQGRHPGRCSS